MTPSTDPSIIRGMQGDRVAELLKSLAPDQYLSAGILFHGTCETIEGPLRPGAYDGVFWAAQTATVAQSYIPRAGSQRILSIPSSYRMDEALRPVSPSDPVTQWALRRAGISWEDLDVEISGHSVRSWATPGDWPRYSDLQSWIAGDLGYGLPECGYWEVSCDYDKEGVEILRPQSWRMAGHLLILHVPDLEIVTPPWSEEGQAFKPHNRIADFALFREMGVEAFHMPDLLQSEHLGNVAHRAIGLLPQALARAEWISIPAERFDSGDSRDFGKLLTPDLEAWLKADPGISREDDSGPSIPGP